MEIPETFIVSGWYTARKMQKMLIDYGRHFTGKYAGAIVCYDGKTLFENVFKLCF